MKRSSGIGLYVDPPDHAIVLSIDVGPVMPDSYHDPRANRESVA